MPQAGAVSPKVTDGPNMTLRDEVREALRAVLSDASASAMAKASAARTLIELFDDGGEASPGRASEMTLDELDEEIARLSRVCQACERSRRP
ncbi:hypothetical protein QA641_20520 [Bradyrhizobium sp. CB1650]|uniref:hypothetical protein n=1 Tax=Bradyrhizobium sp. CB1650 TaxID=3039153 RepID=UPI002434F803|nr:hypothetical protein [Bradyrhizobium sp. CB1650]WGD56067.1 hypothetical protein QA641_20520 [Bradyrhizobium sp. CB1650]